MGPVIRALLRRRLLLVSGKGGTGKTSVSAALALLAARAGIRTSAVELTGEALLPQLLASSPAPDLDAPSPEPRPLAASLQHPRTVPERALIEYLASQIHAPRVARRIVEHPAVKRVLDAAPGWRDLIALGKLWHLTTRSDAGVARWPLLIVDAPATG